ncbi:MAG: FAD-dependent oxidoreductase [Bacteroidota bacterium]|nr:FAD-binding oxidoreductase [Rhodothermia bacterium]MCS7155910.1 FAD-binding oxidoreductase [Bacteroidota bacterium]MDW8138117.1 FAD-dependent oxidoreductase [Bacteroidota bacterium]MDW8285801.1 FAD-dependent oxidoreductase [Bacteroidota bacterium]
MRDVLIIGAGITGAACAWRLATAGLRVLVVHEAPVGTEATGAGMGHITAHGGAPGVWELSLLGRSLWQQWSAWLPPEVEYARISTLWLIPDAHAMQEAQRWQELFIEAGFPAELLEESELALREPHLRSGWLGALWVPDDATIYAPRAAWHLLERAQTLGAKLMQARVVALEENAIRLENGQRLASSWIVIAAGLGALTLLPELPLRPRRGHLAITDRCPGLIRHALVSLAYHDSVRAPEARSRAFNLHPRPNGQVLIGSSREWDLWDRRPNPTWMAMLLAEACAHVPELTSCPVLRAWTGLRAATSDGRPLIGPYPGQPRWLVATGQEGLGIAMAPAVAELVAGYVLDRPPVLDPEPYRLEGRLCPNPS